MTTPAEWRRVHGARVLHRVTVDDGRKVADAACGRAIPAWKLQSSDVWWFGSIDRCRDCVRKGARR